MLPFWAIAVWKGAAGFLAKIPIQVWVALGLIAAVWFAAWRIDAWLEARDQRSRAEERAKVNAAWDERKRVADAHFSAEMNRKRNEVSDWVLAGLATRDALARELRGAELALVDAFDELHNRRPFYVTEKAIAGCTLTRGVVMQFNAGAERANGRVAAPDAPGAAQPAPDAVDEPAGIALDRYTGAVEKTQLALGSCRAQVRGWQQHWLDVTAWYAELARTLDTCFPKGASQ